MTQASFTVSNWKRWSSELVDLQTNFQSHLVRHQPLLGGLLHHQQEPNLPHPAETGSFHQGPASLHRPLPSTRQLLIQGTTSPLNAATLAALTERGCHLFCRSSLQSTSKKLVASRTLLRPTHTFSTASSISAPTSTVDQEITGEVRSRRKSGPGSNFTRRASTSKKSSIVSKWSRLIPCSLRRGTEREIQGK